MKRTMSLLPLVISMAACSGEDVQVSLEKAEPEQRVALKKTTPVNVETQPQETEASKTAKESAAEQPTSVTLKKKPQVEAADMQVFKASLANIDDAQILQKYGEDGSATSLQLGGVALNLSNQGLVSNVKSVSGATSIKSAPTGFGFTIGLSGDYLFEFDKDTLTPKAKEALTSVYTLYLDYQGTHINVVGHTDSKGKSDYNLALSKRRATTVKNWFQNKGIINSLITTQGVGETKPVAPNSKGGKDYPEGRAFNRRVEISVKTKKKISHLPTVSNKTDVGF